MKKTSFYIFVFVLLLTTRALAGQSVVIVYQNDLHGWLFPSSTRVGIDKLAKTLTLLFKKEPSSFYAVSGDLFTGPNFPPETRGTTELTMWNQFWKEMVRKGCGDRVLISAGNHEFDYGVPGQDAFSSGLLCANLVSQENHPYFLPYKVVETGEGLKVGFVGLLLERDSRVIGATREIGLNVVPQLQAAKNCINQMGKLDLTVLMIHDKIEKITKIANDLPAELGVDIIMSGHDHIILEEPLSINGIYICQAGAMNSCYGRVDLVVDRGKITALKNQIVEMKPTTLERTVMRVKEKIDEENGKTVAILKQSLKGVYGRRGENSLGNFVTDAFRWATSSDIAMTNSSSLRLDLTVYPKETFEVKEGHLKTVTPFRNQLTIGRVTGAQVMEVLRGEADHFRNQVSGLTYQIDRRRPDDIRVSDVKVGGMPLDLKKVYTMTHNSYCTRPENMERYLHIKPNSVHWTATGLKDYQVLIDYAQHLKIIDYPSEGEGRIKVID